MNNINRQEPNEIPQKEYPTEKIKINSNYNPSNDKQQQEPRIQSNIANLQNSAIKNFKSGIRSEPANFFL